MNLEKMQELLEEIDEWASNKKELQSILAEEARETFVRIRTLEEEAKRLAEEAAAQRMLLREEHPDIFADMDTVQAELTTRENTLRTLARNMPADALRETNRLVSSRGYASVTISKTPSIVTYDAGILKELPELRDMVVDGDPVVTLSINPHIVERLVSTGKIDAGIAHKYRVVAKARTPSCTLNLGD